MQNKGPFRSFFSLLNLFIKNIFLKEISLAKPIKGQVSKKSKKIIASKGKKESKKKKVKEKIFTFSKENRNPIILPNKNSNWENLQTFNPGAVLINNDVHFLYRAMGDDYFSRLGYANSSDGFTIKERLPHPVFELNSSCKRFSTTYRSSPSGGGIGGCEDARIVKIEEDGSLYVTYTDFTDGQIRMAITSIKTNDFIEKKWEWERPIFISPPNQSNKNWVIFPEKINGKYAIVHSISPRILIEYLDDLNFKNSKYIKSHYQRDYREDVWDYWVRGAGPPPIKTKDGWLLIYHAMSKDDFSKYKVGAMLLDLKDPSKILYRSKNPILVPEEIYENNGYKPGIVYVSGAVVKDEDIILYYGGADNYVCAAYANLEKFLGVLKKNGSINLKKKKIINKKYDFKKV